MPRKIEMLAYSFAELSEDVQAKVLDSHREINVADSYWYEFPREEFENELESYGFNCPVSTVSGFYSQGDGASFVCDSINLALVPNLSLRERWLDSLDFQIETNAYRNYYVHANTIHVKYTGSVESDSNVEKLADDLADKLTIYVRELSNEYYSRLESEYDYLTSDDSVRETIVSNDYEFTNCGEII